MTKNSTTVNRIKNQPSDIPGLPTLAEVERAMSMEGRKADHTRAALVISAWDGPAWKEACYEGVAARRQRCYEQAARTLQAYDAAAAAKAPVVKAVPVKPRSAGRTTILFDAGQRRRTPNFGKNILPSLPTYESPVSLDDLFATDAFHLDGEIDPDQECEQDWDALYRDAAYCEKVCQGFHL